MYTPVNPSFTIEKWGLRGSKLYRHVFVIRTNIGMKAKRLSGTSKQKLSRTKRQHHCKENLVIRQFNVLNRSIGCNGIISKKISVIIRIDITVKALREMLLALFHKQP